MTTFAGLEHLGTAVRGRGTGTNLRLGALAWRAIVSRLVLIPKLYALLVRLLPNGSCVCRACHVSGTIAARGTHTHAGRQARRAGHGLSSAACVGARLVAGSNLEHLPQRPPRRPKALTPGHRGQILRRKSRPPRRGGCSRPHPRPPYPFLPPPSSCSCAGLPQVRLSRVQSLEYDQRAELTKTVHFFRVDDGSRHVRHGDRGRGRCKARASSRRGGSRCRCLTPVSCTCARDTFARAHPGVLFVCILTYIGLGVCTRRCSEYSA